jgi:hypothetical protein
LYVSTIDSLISFDLTNDAILWERKYEGGCDRMAISPDGKGIYLPSFEKDHWHVVDAASGEIITRVEPQPGAHNTIFGPNGREVYLAGLRSDTLAIVDPATNQIVRRVGPFSAAIRPFTVNGSQTLAYLCVNNLLGFEIGNLVTGERLGRVEVQGFPMGKPARHGCPSYGIGMTPDEKEIWVCDAFNRRMHIFDATVTPPNLVASIPVREEPGWITFSIDGRWGYPSTGDVIEVATHRIVTGLAAEDAVAVHSEKLLEIDFESGRAVRAGCQFGLGAVAGK